LGDKQKFARIFFHLPKYHGFNSQLHIKICSLCSTFGKIQGLSRPNEPGLNCQECPNNFKFAGIPPPPVSYGLRLVPSYIWVLQEIVIKLNPIITISYPTIKLSYRNKKIIRVVLGFGYYSRYKYFTKYNQ